MRSAFKWTLGFLIGLAALVAAFGYAAPNFHAAAADFQNVVAQVATVPPAQQYDNPCALLNPDGSSSAHDLYLCQKFLGEKYALSCTVAYQGPVPPKNNPPVIVPTPCESCTIIGNPADNSKNP